MSTSAKQLAANRRNAKHSTGPKTPEGKASSSKNATTHGLLARDTVATFKGCEENQQDFLDTLERNREEFSPESGTEEFLVEEITILRWKLRRINRMERHLFPEFQDPNSTADDKQNDACRNLIRYRNSINKDLRHALADLEHQKDRRRAKALEPQPVDWVALEKQVNENMARAKAEYRPPREYDYAKKAFIDPPSPADDPAEPESVKLPSHPDADAYPSTIQSYDSHPSSGW
jgi:hypothetical protein